MDTIEVPDAYHIQITWGPYNENNLRDNLFYKSGDHTISHFNTIYKDSVFNINSFNINKETADSLYKLTLRNSKRFNLSDTVLLPQSHGYNLNITLNQNYKSVSNSYHSLCNYAINQDIEQITEIIKRLTKNRNFFD
jgi:hypothetical protein